MTYVAFKGNFEGSHAWDLFVYLDIRVTIVAQVAVQIIGHVLDWYLVHEDNCIRNALHDCRGN
jgi:hypothetical protein